MDPIARRIDRLAGAFRGTAARGAGRLVGVAVLAALVVAAHLARPGTPAARGAAAAAVVALIGALVALTVRERRTWRDARRVLSRVLAPSDPALGARTLRALRLFEGTRERGDERHGSPELARLHLERLLDRASVDAITAHGARRARRATLAAAAVGVLTAGALVAAPLRTVEGLDILLARDGVAPVPLPWLADVSVVARPPAHLGTTERAVLLGLPARLPEGSQLTVRGRPRFDGRRLELYDGARSAPFVADGDDGLIARWTVDSARPVHVAARFGAVVIRAPEPVEILPVEDTPPLVELADAPRTVELAAQDRVELTWRARDDHSLREVRLVLRSGTREERRVLERFDDLQPAAAGGHAITPRDAFLRRAYLPIEVTIEARDDDSLRGPKWGTSAPVILVPPAVGEPEARRHRALEAGRDALVDLVVALAARGAERAAAAALTARRAALARELEDAALASHAGLELPAGLGAFLRGRAQSLGRPLAPGESELRRAEDALLAWDTALRGLARRDATSVSRRLADVVEDVELAARLARRTEDTQRALFRLDAAAAAARAGGGQLATLGALGADLGDVARAGLERIRRLREANDLGRTELAARHLAQRLRHAAPSFRSAPSSRGGPSALPGDGAGSGAPSRADDHFDQLAREVEELTRDHAAAVAEVERALGGADDAPVPEELAREARERALAVRRATGRLPRGAGPEPSTARGAAALAREHAEALAQALERLSLEDAVQAGRDALERLTDAERRAKASPAGAAGVEADALREARGRIAHELAWAERLLEERTRSAESRAHDALEKVAGTEAELARRSGNLSARGRSGQSGLPDDASSDLERAGEAMSDAARELRAGKGSRALERQREAQRLLERATTGETSAESPGERAAEAAARERRGDPRRASGRITLGGEVPGAAAEDRARELRRRAIEGLGDARGPLAPAVRRYAEGLVQ
ncbi:MAG: DUF4175 domain-containing protein [Polyangiaceae bacterium]|nr:DUF4175 domain-containing protein [Polyangiaceae bacterium]